MFASIHIMEGFECQTEASEHNERARESLRVQVRSVHGAAMDVGGEVPSCTWLVKCGWLSYGGKLSVNTY